MTTQTIVGGRKRCARCRQRMHVREFAPKAHLSSGLNSWCRGCQRAATRAWRAENREAILTGRRAAYAAAKEAAA